MLDSPTFHRVKRRLLDAWPADAWRDTRVVLGLSGGPDSVALLRLLNEIKREVGGAGRIIAAHFDHRWRLDSSEDARFAEDLAAQFGIEFRRGVNPLAPQTSDQLAAPQIALAVDRREAQARQERYQFLVQTALATGARWLAVGHTRDDQVETILHQIMRGSGLRGASGMPATRCLHEAVTLVRPLLAVPRVDLHELLAAWGQSFCQDPSNAAWVYSRARIRHDILPAMRSVHPEADLAILRLGQIAGEADQFLRSLAQRMVERCTARDETASDESEIVALEAIGLRREPAILVREAMVQIWRSHGWPLQDMTYEKWCSLDELIRRPEGGCDNLPGQITVCCDRDIVRIQRRKGI